MNLLPNTSQNSVCLFSVNMPAQPFLGMYNKKEYIELHITTINWPAHIYV